MSPLLHFFTTHHFTCTNNITSPSLVLHSFNASFTSKHYIPHLKDTLVQGCEGVIRDIKKDGQLPAEGTHINVCNVIVVQERYHILGREVQAGLTQLVQKVVCQVQILKEIKITFACVLI